jgi:hypothetical protein
LIALASALSGAVLGAPDRLGVMDGGAADGGAMGGGGWVLPVSPGDAACAFGGLCDGDTGAFRLVCGAPVVAALGDAEDVGAWFVCTGGDASVACGGGRVGFGAA